MRGLRTILIGVLILTVATVLLAAAAAIVKRPAVRISQMAINKNVVLLAGTGVQGSLTFPAAATLDSQLKTMSCGDIKVFVGKWVTPPPPSGSNMPGGPLSIPEFQAVASTTATGGFPSCSYAIRNAPAAMPLDMVIDSNQRFQCNVTTLATQPSYSGIHLTFTKGEMKTQNFQVTPDCVIVY